MEAAGVPDRRTAGRRIGEGRCGNPKGSGRAAGNVSKSVRPPRETGGARRRHPRRLPSGKPGHPIDPKASEESRPACGFRPRPWYSRRPVSGKPGAVQYDVSEFGPGTAVRQYDEGTLLVDVVDAETLRVIWRGWARADVTRLIDQPETLGRLVDEAARATFLHFPREPVSRDP